MPAFNSFIISNPLDLKPTFAFYNERVLMYFIFDPGEKFDQSHNKMEGQRRCRRE